MKKNDGLVPDVDTALYIVMAMLGGVIALPDAPAWVKEFAGVLQLGVLAWKIKRSRGIRDKEVARVEIGADVRRIE